MTIRFEIRQLKIYCTRCGDYVAYENRAVCGPDGWSAFTNGNVTRPLAGCISDFVKSTKENRRKLVQVLRRIRIRRET